MADDTPSRFEIQRESGMTEVTKGRVFSQAATKVRLEANNRLVITFPEDISRDISAIEQAGEVPLEFVAAALTRAAVAKRIESQCGRMALSE